MSKSKKPSPVSRWKPASAEWVRAFGGAARELTGAEQRKMFGYPAAFVNGHMFAGLHESGLVLRLGDSDRAALLALPGAKPFEPMPGRPMRQYAVAPAGFVSKPAEVRAWLRKALAYGSSLPAKSASRKKGKAR